MNVDLDRTTAAVLAADQAHLTRMKEDASWGREGLLGRLTRDDRRAAGGGGYSGAASPGSGRAQEQGRERA
jgi:hypothetical protein